MKTRVLGALLALTLVAAPVWAQDHRVEIGFNGGYSLSEGVSVNADTVEGLLIDEVNPKSGSSWGLNLNVYASEQVQFGFLFGQQSSTLELKPSGAFQKFDVSDMKVNNYHGTFTYNFGYGDAPIRPFIFGGLGATHYSPEDVMGFMIESSTRFSTTWGGGVKAYVSDNVGFNFTARWVPTYISSDPAGIWCSPYWPGACWVLSEANYSNQFDLSGGVNFRF